MSPSLLGFLLLTLWLKGSVRNTGPVSYLAKGEVTIHCLFNILSPKLLCEQCKQLLCIMTKNAQLFHKLSHYYMFRHYPVILRQPVINTLPSYTSISNSAIGNTIYN